MAEARCPDCAIPMHAVHADALDLARCDGCGAAWVAQQELRARAPGWATNRLERLSERSCPECLAKMDLVKTPEGIELDSCAACDGLYFDPGELRDALPARSGQADSPGAFTCIKCGGRFPIREGNAVGAGLACRACTPQSQLTTSERREANREEIQLSDVHSFMDLVEYLLQSASHLDEHHW